MALAARRVWVVGWMCCAALAACTTGVTTAPTTTTSTTPVQSTTEATPSPTAESATSVTDSSPSTTAAPVVGPSRDVLAQLVVVDAPHSASGYRRDEWPHWRDIDHDGCDARQQALIAASKTKAQVDTPCTVVAGDWASDYDALDFTDPADLDVDHVVPLENAYVSGGWGWSTDQRAQYANDQADLWVVSATSNRSKGAQAPDQWRPPNRGIWCTYAQRWAAIKLRWKLSVTSTERDALGEMLDTCNPSASPTPPPAEASTTAAPATTAPPAPSTAFKNCAEARAAGKAPLHRGDPGYADNLDRDHDGVACE